MNSWLKSAFCKRRLRPGEGWRRPSAAFTFRLLSAVQLVLLVPHLPAKAN